MRIRLVASAAVALASLLAAMGGPAWARQEDDEQDTSPAEYRALWVDAFHPGIKTTKQVDMLVESARRANVNALIVQVRKRGDRYFNQTALPDPEPRAEELAPNPDYDPLGYLIARAHAGTPRLEVHAWLNVFHVGAAALQRHPADWANQRFDGSTGAYVDPGNPDAARYTHDIFLDVVKNYDLDGIHLDFVRYPEGGDWGYSAVALKRFSEESGSSERPLPNDVTWSQWRREQVTSFVRSVYQDATTLKPKLKVSAALIAWGAGPVKDRDWWATRTYNEALQDWRAWLDEGILDVGVVMNYDRERDERQRLWFDQWIKFEKTHQGARRLLVGLGAFLNRPEDTFEQLRRARLPYRGRRVAGVALYSYGTTSVFAEKDASFNDWFYSALSQPANYRDPAGGQVETSPPYEEPSPIPDLPWKEEGSG